MTSSTPTRERMPWDGLRTAVSLRRRESGQPTPTTAELVVIDLVAQHDEQPHEQLPSDGDFGFGTSTSMDEREVGSPEVGIHAGRMRRRLTEDQAAERAALLADVAEGILCSGVMQGSLQA